MPLISVIVPVYNVERFLPKCIDSILNQSFTDFELILVDDGSPDNCGLICDRYAEDDDRITVIHQKNGGLSSARNAGIDWSVLHSNSEWLSFVDSDDFIHRQYLELLLLAVRKFDRKIAVCNFTSIEDQNASFEGMPLIDNRCCSICEIETETVYSSAAPSISAWAKLYHKSLWNDSIRFPVGKINEDRFTTYKLLFQEDSIVFIDEVLYFYLIREGSIIHSSWTPKRFDDYEACEEQISFFSKNGFKDAERYTRLQYLYLLSVGVINSKDYPKEHKIIKRRFNERFKCEKKASNITFLKNSDIFLARHPLTTKAYLYSAAALSVIRESGFKELIKKVIGKMHRKRSR